MSAEVDRAARLRRIQERLQERTRNRDRSAESLDIEWLLTEVERLERAAICAARGLRAVTIAPDGGIVADDPWRMLSARAQNLLLDHGVDTTPKLLAFDSSDAAYWPNGGKELAKHIREVQEATRKGP